MARLPSVFNMRPSQVLRVAADQLAVAPAPVPPVEIRGLHIAVSPEAIDRVLLSNDPPPPVAAPVPEPEVVLEPEIVLEPELAQEVSDPEPVDAPVTRSSLASLKKIELVQRSIDLGLALDPTLRKEDLVNEICAHLGIL